MIARTVATAPMGQSNETASDRWRRDVDSRMRSLGVSVRRLARESSVPRNTLHRMLSGHHSVRLDAASDVVEALVRLEWRRRAERGACGCSLVRTTTVQDRHEWDGWVRVSRRNHGIETWVRACDGHLGEVPL